MSWAAIALLVAACSLAALGVWLYVARRRRLRRVVRRAARRQAPRHPIVLVHGIFGFDEIAFGPARTAYFAGLDEVAAKLGVSILRPRLPAISSISRRAAALDRFLLEMDARRVNVVAHSMGGLDTRYALTHLGLSERVASLITIGTPHRGTPIADIGARLMGERVRRIAAALGLHADAFDDLTCARMIPFNLDVTDQREVFYGSVVAGAPERGPISPLLLPCHRFLLKRAGENDGLVPKSSQAWGDVLCEVEADHWAQIGWSRHFAVADLFEELCRELRGRGL